MKWIAIHREKISVVHLQDYTTWLLPFLVKALHHLKLPVVATVHNLRPHGAKSNRPSFEERITRIGLRSLDGIFVHTGLDADKYSQEIGASVEKIHSIEHGLLAEARSPQIMEASRALFFGHWRHNKGILQLLDAAASLDQWEFQVIGASGDREIPEYCWSRSPSNVTFRDEFVANEDIESIFGWAKVCVLPYQQFDAQSGVLHLSIAMGIPVVVTPVGGMASVVQEYGCGVVAGGTDAPSIAEAIRRFENRDFYMATLDGVCRVQNALDWATAARETASVYRRVGQIG